MAKAKGGLGRGLAALIRPTSERPQAADSAQAREHAVGDIAEIDIARVRPNPYQPRADFDETALDELKRSIIEKGVIQPITVRRKSDAFELVSGERRVRAALEAGLKKIPAYVIEVHRDEEMLELALIENLQREHLNPVEIAISYRRLISDCNLTQEDVAQKIGKDRTTVTNFLRLLKLPDKIQTGLRKNQLSTGHARALVAIDDEKTQLRIYDKIVKKGLSVRQVEQLVRAVGQRNQPKARIAGHIPTATQSALISVEERIRNALATKVTVHHRGGGKGDIVIEYYSNDDLDRLLDLFGIIEKYNA